MGLSVWLVRFLLTPLVACNIIHTGSGERPFLSHHMSVPIEEGFVMRTSLRAIRSLIGSRLGLSLIAGIGLITQLQCGGGGDSGGSDQPPSGVTGDVKAIARENALPGTGAWQIGNPSRSGEIVAYSNRESYPAGSDVSISVSANPAEQFTWRVFRMGGYGGTGGRSICRPGR